jgi:hypothetical protein
MALETDWRLFDYDLVTGKAVFMRFEGDQLKVRTVMPVDDLVDENADRRAETAGTKWGDGIQHVARIPIHMWQRQLAEPLLQEDQKALSKWLNDPDNAAFRTREGKV